MSHHHTPGPWELIRSERFAEFYVQGASSHVCVVSWSKNHEDESEANARLIAAAPVMFTALEMIASGKFDAPYCQELARAAIEGLT